jgi:PKD repeat protein
MTDEYTCVRSLEVLMRRHIAPLAAAGVAFATLALGLPAAGPVQLEEAEPASVHFTAAGDYHFTAAGGDAAVNARAVAVFTKIAEIHPDLNLSAGDLSYGATGSEQAWCDAVTPYLGAGFPFELVSGNHESNGLNGNINDFSACMPNQLPGAVGTYGRQWYVDVPAQNPVARFVMISPGLTFPDGTYDYTVGSPRYAWTAAAIDGARAASIPWVVVDLHKPCLSTGVYGCESGADLLNLLVAKRVDLVLQGHQHVYERTKQLALAPGCAEVVPGSANAACIADADADLVKGAGTVFTTVSTGGGTQRALNPADPEAPYFAASSGADTATWGVLDVQATATTLAATFVRAAGGTFTDAFTIGPAGPVENRPPTAAFTASCAETTCSLDALSSTDPDGTITSYAWAFGDGTTGTGATASHTYAVAGTYPVTLTVTDDDGATGTVSHDVAAVANQPPLAAFTSTATNLAVAVDGSGSSDADGTIASYAWAFGDGTTGTGATASHTYAVAGTYPVTLTVTDDDGATGAVSHDVTVTAPVGPVPFATDAFGRTTAQGWGNADLGGAWTIAGNAAYFSVAGGSGQLRLARAGGMLSSYLTGVSATDTDVQTTVSLDRPATGGVIYVSLIGRRIVGVGDYRARFKFLETGAVQVQVQRNEITIQTANVTGPTYTPGATLHLRLQVTGTAPTTVRAKGWYDGQAEPGWQLTMTDSTAGLQTAGSLGVSAYVSSTATALPVVTRFDNLIAAPTA